MPSSNPNTEFVEEQLPSPVTEEIWKLILDRSKTYDIIVHLLKGEVMVPEQDKQGNTVWGWKRTRKSYMNNEGIGVFSSILYSAMTPDKVTTFLTDDEVNKLAFEMSITVVEIIEEQGGAFGIDAADRTLIVKLVDDFYFLNLTGSRKGTILDALTMGYERKEFYTPQDQKKGFSFKSFLGK